MKTITSLLIILSLVTIIIGLPQFPLKQRKIDELPKDNYADIQNANTIAANVDKNKKYNYASIQSQIIATSLLKDNMDIDGNHIYSPLGISSILGVLAEGSRGDTYKEFMTALGYPENKTELRESFKQIFDNFHQKPLDFSDDNTSPTFKTWLYIYRNNTACQEFKDIIKNYYSVDVKDINRTEFDWNEPDTTARTAANISSNTNALQSEKESIREPVNSKDILNFEDLKKSESIDNEENVPVTEKETITDNMTSEFVDPIVLMKESSKFDSIVDDKQYVEVPIIKAEIAKQEEEKDNQKQEQIEETRKNDDMMLIEEMIELNDVPTIENIEKKKIDKVEKMIITEIKEEIKNIEEKLNNDENVEFNVEDNETINDDEKLEELRKNIDGKNEIIIEYIKESNEPEKIIIPIEKLDDGEMMEAAESRHFKQRFTRSRTLLHKDDIASALSANSITGKENPSKTKMLLFNGLYYRGNWAYPFQELRKAHVKEPFFVSSHKSMPVEMMRTHGKFQIGNLESLDSQAIVLPYENKRYSFVLIVPNEKEGLRKLIETIQPVDLQLLSTRLVDMDTSICLPKFEVEETSRSEITLKKLGLKKIFSKYSADLGDLSEDSSLHVEEIVQHVNLRVDEGAASKNSLTGSNPSNDNKQVSRSDIIKDDDKSIMVNRPFLYFVMDQLNDFIIVSGKITLPEFLEEFGLADDV